jgi:hypothetical protein
MTHKQKNYFTFKFFNELEKGDVFKFEKILDNDIHSIFFTVYFKDDITTKINSTYGKKILRFEYPNNKQSNVIVFPYRKRN